MSFSTPPPVMKAHLPSADPQPLEPLFLVAFDQRVDPEAVLRTTQVRADGQVVSIRLATDDELEADKEAVDGGRGDYGLMEDLGPFIHITVRGHQQCVSADAAVKQVEDLFSHQLIERYDCPIIQDPELS